METELKKPTKKDRELAKRNLSLLEKAANYAADDGVAEIRFGGTDEVVRVPQKAVKLFTAIISKMADGQAVKLVVMDEQISTQDAADYLHVSRPYLVKLLEKGEIPFVMVGAHRRVALRDVELYAQKIVANRQKQLEFLAKQAQEMNLGY